MAIRRAQPDLLKGEPLKQAVRKICAEEFKRVTYEPWRSRGYPSLSTWERFYEAHKRVAALVRSVIETMNQLRALRGGRFNLFLGEWLKDVHEFKNGNLKLAEWSAALGLSALLLDPSGSTIKDVAAAVDARTTSIRQELKDFIAGTKSRVDE